MDWFDNHLSTEENMEKITVKKVELLKQLEENKANHRAKFEKAIEGWRRDSIASATAFIENIKSNRKVVGLVLDSIPKDMSSEYDTVIAMCKWNIEDTMELSQQEVQQYILDDWSWKKNWTTSNAKYIE